MRKLALLAPLFAACAATQSTPAAPPATEPVTSDAPAVPQVAPALRDRAAAVLEGALAAAEPALAEEALVALGAARTADARARLETALTADRGETRFAAARGLRLLADPQTGPAIATAFRKEKGHAVRQELALAAGTIALRELAPELREAAAAPQEKLADAAAWALVQLGETADEEAVARAAPGPKPGTDRWSRKVLRGELEGDAQLAARTLVLLAQPEDAAIFEPKLAFGTDPVVRLWAAAGILRR